MRETLTDLPAKANPWNLTPQQCSTLFALAALGSTKLAARELAVAPKTIEQHVREAKRKMGIEHRVTAIVAWDRWKTGRAA